MKIFLFFSKQIVINTRNATTTQYMYIILLKVKCFKYWPNNGKTEIYGTFSVEVIEEKVYAFFTKRIFKVSQLGVSNEL